jgi:hypothetical protein
MRRWRHVVLTPSPWLLCIFFLTAAAGEEELGGGEFVAGSFILTQKALDEAPYRYSTFLTEV